LLTVLPFFRAMAPVFEPGAVLPMPLMPPSIRRLLHLVSLLGADRQAVPLPVQKSLSGFGEISFFVRLFPFFLSYTCGWEVPHS